MVAALGVQAQVLVARGEAAAAGAPVLRQAQRGQRVQRWGHSRPLLSQGWQTGALAEVLTPAELPSGLVRLQTRRVRGKLVVAWSS